MDTGTDTDRHDFNPRSREGSDISTRCDLAVCRNFNPRSREGSDESNPKHRPWSPDFNPRSREGSDLLVTDCAGVADISIHAPVKGATLWDHPRSWDCIFQSTLP